MSLISEPAAARGLLNANAPPYSAAPTLASLRHGFFGREGGVSSGIYASLNAGVGSNDDPDAVRENRRRIAAAFDIDLARLVGVHQVHSPKVVHVTQAWPGERPHADALVTTTPALVLSVLTADCAPILLADRDAGVIGAAHAGWKGALSGVIENTLIAMRELGARNIVAAIGPCIHQSSYEVGPEFEANFTAADPESAIFFIPGKQDRRLFDLPGFCERRLKACGVAEVALIMRDTYAQPETLHSHRRSVHEALSDYGRNCAAIMLD